MLTRFRISLSNPSTHTYEVIRFTPEIYFVRSVNNDKLAGYLNGISIWKTEGNWISSSGNDESLVTLLGNCIDDHINNGAVQLNDGSRYHL